jgi:hypothetical protein
MQPFTSLRNRIRCGAGVDIIDIVPGTRNVTGSRTGGRPMADSARCLDVSRVETGAVSDMAGYLALKTQVIPVVGI